MGLFSWLKSAGKSVYNVGKKLWGHKDRIVNIGKKAHRYGKEAHTIGKKIKHHYDTAKHIYHDSREAYGAGGGGLGGAALSAGTAYNRGRRLGHELEGTYGRARAGLQDARTLLHDVRDLRHSIRRQ